MQKHITSFTADRITVEILSFLEQKFPAVHAMLSVFLAWIPMQDAYTNIRFRDNVFYTKLNGTDHGIAVQRAFIANGDVIAVFTFRNKVLDSVILKNQPNENMHAILLSSTPQASDENLIAALGDGTNRLFSEVIKNLEGIDQGIHAEYMTSSTYVDGSVKAEFFIHSRFGSSCAMDIEAANPRFIKSFVANILANIPKELYR